MKWLMTVLTLIRNGRTQDNIRDHNFEPKDLLV